MANKDMSAQKMTIKDRLKFLHEQEDIINREMGKISAQIHKLNKEKAKLSLRVSNNMKYRNRLIKLL